MNESHPDFNQRYESLVEGFTSYICATIRAQQLYPQRIVALLHFPLDPPHGSFHNRAVKPLQKAQYEKP